MAELDLFYGKAHALIGDANGLMVKAAVTRTIILTMSRGQQEANAFAFVKP
jgi:hypothetical protein